MQRNFHPTNGKGRNQRLGFVAMELAIALPILCTVLFALFEFSLLFFARSEVVRASRVAARLASLPGVTSAAVETEIRKVLSPALERQMQADVDLGNHAGDVVQVAVRVPMRQAAPDLLWPIGFSLRDRYLYAISRMIKE